MSLLYPNYDAYGFERPSYFNPSGVYAGGFYSRPGITTLGLPPSYSLPLSLSVPSAYPGAPSPTYSGYSGYSNIRSYLTPQSKPYPGTRTWSPTRRAWVNDPSPGYSAPYDRKDENNAPSQKKRPSRPPVKPSRPPARPSRPLSSSTPAPKKAPEKRHPGVYTKFAPGEGANRALLIGINYHGQDGELRGCLNDVETMRRFIHANGYSQENIKVLVDDRRFGTIGENKKADGALWRSKPVPTRKNIIEAMQQLVRDAAPGDNLFFFFAGHGGQLEDQDGDEADGKDETICPVDFAERGEITDDEIFKILIDPLEQGVRLTAIMDCCHSGTVLDLPYEFLATDDSLAEAAKGTVQMHPNQRLTQGGGKKNHRFQLMSSDKDVKADVIMFSGCADTQTSADVHNTSSFHEGKPKRKSGTETEAGGACTNALVAVYRHHQQLGDNGVPFICLLDDMRHMLKTKDFDQIPQLSSSRPLDMRAPFWP